MSIKTANIDIKILTEMQSHGADTKKAIFRITELKAVMRFWWRAINCFNTSEHKDILKCEEYIFGGTTKERGEKSPVMIKFRERSANLSEINQKIKSSCFDEQFIKLTMVVNHDKIDIDYYLELLQIASFFGNLGSKSTKGFGSFTVDSDKVGFELIKLNNIGNKLKALNKKTFEICNSLDNEKDIIGEVDYNFNRTDLTLKRDCINSNDAFYLQKVHISQVKSKGYIDISEYYNRLCSKNKTDGFTLKSTSPIIASLFRNSKNLYFIISEFNQNEIKIREITSKKSSVEHYNQLKNNYLSVYK